MKTRRDMPMPLHRSLLGVALLGVALAGCDLDVTNPNAPTGEEVRADLDGLVAVAVGMQDLLAEGMEDFVVAPALVTDEWGTGSLSLVSYRELFLGVDLAPDRGVVEAPFAATYRVVSHADEILAGLETLEGIGAGLSAGMEALARLHRAMALGYSIMHFEEIPIDITVDEPVPVGRDAVLGEILGELEEARSVLSAVSDDQLAGFDNRVKGSGLDLRNTIDAMLARYYLMDGQFQAAIDAAERVDRTVLSTVVYVSPDRNPVQNLMMGLRYTKPLFSWVETAEPGDERVDYWVDVTAPAPDANPPDTLLREPERYSSSDESFPLYLPGEMLLIQAEAHTRLGNLDTARGLVNQVRTQSSSPVDEPVANLPELPESELDTEAELLDQIAYERKYELYVQGLRWEDTRRLGEARTVEPNFLFLPMPTQECRANPVAC